MCPIGNLSTWKIRLGMIGNIFFYQKPTLWLWILLNHVIFIYICFSILPTCVINCKYQKHYHDFVTSEIGFVSVGIKFIYQISFCLVHLQLGICHCKNQCRVRSGLGIAKWNRRWYSDINYPKLEDVEGFHIRSKINCSLKRADTVGNNLAVEPTPTATCYD